MKRGTVRISKLSANQVSASLRLVVMSPALMIIGVLALADDSPRLGSVVVAVGVLILVISVYRLRRHERAVKRER